MAIGRMEIPTTVEATNAKNDKAQNTIIAGMEMQ